MVCDLCQREGRVRREAGGSQKKIAAADPIYLSFILPLYPPRSAAAFLISRALFNYRQDRQLALLKSLESFINPTAYREAYEKPQFKMETDPDIMKETASAAADLLSALIGREGNL